MKSSAIIAAVMLRSICRSPDKQHWALIVLPLLLAACGDSGDAPVQAQRISLEDARAKVAEPLLSPDTEGAMWTVTGNGQAIHFAQPDAKPFLTLACELRETPARITLVRHVPARPGQKALFPVIGNGTISRFKIDAALHEGEWRWEGELPASDPQLEVFTGPRELEATMPGGGMLVMAGSRIPGEFVNWCRMGGRAPQVEGEDAGDEAEGEEDPLDSASPPEPTQTQ